MNLLVGLAVSALVAVGVSAAWVADGRRSGQTSWATPARVVAGGYLALGGIGAVSLAASGEATAGPLLMGMGILVLGLAARAAARRTPVPPGPASIVDDRSRPRLRVAILLAAAGLAMFAWIGAERGLPLLSGDAQAVRASFAGLRMDLFRWLAPPAALLLVAVALRTRRGHDMAAAAIAVGIVASLEVAAASRALPFELGVGAILLATWEGVRVRARTWALIGAAAVILFVGVLFARVAPEGGFSDPLDAARFAINRTVGRVILIQPRTLETIVDTFPDELPYLAGGTHLRWLDRLRGAEPDEPLGSILFRRLFPGEPAGGFAAPGLLGEGTANFGPIWGIALMAIVGAVAGWLGPLMRRLPSDPGTRTLLALIVVALLRTYATSLNGFLLTLAAAGLWWAAVAAPGDGWRTRFRSLGSS